MRLEKCRRKKWFGLFKICVVVVCVVDVVFYYYFFFNNVGGLNFEDFFLFLELIFLDFIGDEKFDFVKV